jgi:cytochrome bd-type quinol oxidase subunit 2
MKKLLTKKNILVTSGIITGCIVLLNVVGVFKICADNYDCAEAIAQIVLVLYSLPVVFLLSLVTYKMRDEIFAAWISFAVCWIPLSMLAILLTPADDGGSFSIPLKGPLALFCAVALLVISLVIIIYKHFTLKKGGMGK